MLLDILSTSLLGNLLTGKEVIRASEETIRGDEGMIRPSDAAPSFS